MDNRFVFIAPVYNAANTLEQMIASVVSQSYRNWRIVLIDDMSDEVNRDKQRWIVRRYKDLLNDGPGMNARIVYHENTRKEWEVANVLYGMLQYCNTGINHGDDIICRIDGDDWLVDNDILHIINARYEQKDLKCLWTAHRWGFSDMNISSKMDSCQDPHSYPWVSSHLKTFRRSLLDNVPVENFLGKDGTYIKRAGDQAIYLPALHNANGHWWFEPRAAYHYSIDIRPETFQSEDAKFQKEEAEFIRNRGYVETGKPWEQCFEIKT